MARPRHYGKNVLFLVGIALAYAAVPAPVAGANIARFFLGLVATCLIASSNYVLNEVLDAESDRFHPQKRHRPVPARRISLRTAAGVWLMFGAAGLALAACLGRSFLAAAGGFFIMALAYNVPPVRLKDLPYLDVLSEGVNSPIRLLLGWTLVLPSDPPGTSLVAAFWAAGAFAMAWKRLRELRCLKDPVVAAAYRKSFAHYGERRLKIFAAICGSAAVAAFAWVSLKFVLPFTE